MKWRSIPETLKLIKLKDPDSAITEYAIRKLAKEGQLETLLVGRKIFINVAGLLGGDNQTNG